MTEVAVATIGLIGVLATAVLAYRGQRAARAVNDAVNHRHHPDEPRLLDLVRHIHRDVNDLQQWRHRVDGRIDHLQDTLVDHVEWEMQQKYDDKGRY